MNTFITMEVSSKESYSSSSYEDLINFYTKIEVRTFSLTLGQEKQITLQLSLFTTYLKTLCYNFFEFLWNLAR
jgi:hypothetical protein